MALISGVPAIRNPFVPRSLLRAWEFARRPGLWKRYAQVCALSAFGSRFHERMQHAKLASPDGALGIIETGSLNTSLLRQALTNLPDGTWELVCHPGYADADLRASHTRLLASRERERE